jgi:hypothetical protein
MHATRPPGHQTARDIATAKRSRRRANGMQTLREPDLDVENGMPSAARAAFWRLERSPGWFSVSCRV